MTSSAATLATPSLAKPTVSNPAPATPIMVREPRDLTGEPLAGPSDRTKAFEDGVRRGRQEERLRHKGHPLMTLAVVVMAAAGAAVIAVAAHEGSFSKGGAVVDHNLTVAADNAQVQAADAAGKAERAVKDAGDKVQQKVSDAVAAKN